MASSVVYSSVFAAVLASLRSLRTQLVVFDTAIVDLSDKLEDPVEVLFGTQLGGGTDINQALAYSHTLVRKPSDTIMLLISDLYEGGDEKELLKRAFKVREGRTKLLKKYAGKVEKSVSPIVAARWAQVEHALQAAIDLQMASELPLIK